MCSIQFSIRAELSLLRSWRKRVGVEPTIRSAKDRIAGFEGRGSHRTPFASAGSIAGEESVLGKGRHERGIARDEYR